MIRVATEKDLPEIVRVHGMCFPTSFTTAMGKHLLSRYYAEFMKKKPELFLISVDETTAETVNGFCMGYYGENSSCTKQFIQNNRFRFAFRVMCLLLNCNRSAWERVAGVLRKKAKTITVDKTFGSFEHKDSGELLSICVLPAQRGSGIASQLVDQYIRVLAEQGRHRCVLSVLSNNQRAIHFYEKKGFSLFKKIGDTSLVYAKILCD